MATSICNRCGQPIIFRMINGQTTPIHTHGGCEDDHLFHGVETYAGLRRDRSSLCFSTTCPRGCGSEVFFIRYNGGSVWVDPPLGWPWPKHPCMYEDDLTPVIDHLAADLGEIEEEFRGTALLGVISETDVRRGARVTYAKLLTSENQTLDLKLKHNAGLLLGRLCVYVPEDGLIWPASDRSHASATVGINAEHVQLASRQTKESESNTISSVEAAIREPKEVNTDSDDWTICPECDVRLKAKNLKRHRKRHHKVPQRRPKNLE